MSSTTLPSRARGAALGTAPIVTFFALAYALSWAAWTPLALLGQTVHHADTSPSHMPGLLGPMLAALITTAHVDGRPGLRDLFSRMTRWRVDARWWAAAISPLAFLAVATPVARIVDGSWPDWSAFDEMNGLPAIGVISVWVLVVLINGFGEETGWRGFAILRLQQKCSPLAATLILAVLWAFWHAPLFFMVDGFGEGGPGMLAGFLFAMACGAVVLTWLVNHSGSILIVAVWHGTYNIVAGSAGADGTVAAVVSTLVMAQAIVLVALELRARRRGRPGILLGS
ncbi:MAG TPA: CPBP family intramembrane glutamic endopeptidase [Thermomicrobiales bacterium]|nr:CPBP family intramembrane glutamic endopeptidase [Thermomicrobiales bacterium]